MRNKFFKFSENYANVIKHLDDRQAGQYLRAISDYAFEGKTYGGKDTAVKTAFTLTKQMLSLIHISEPTRLTALSRMPSSA